MNLKGAYVCVSFILLSTLDGAMPRKRPGLKRSTRLFLTPQFENSTDCLAQRYTQRFSRELDERSLKKELNWASM